MSDPGTTTIIVEAIGGFVVVTSSAIGILLKQSFKRNGELRDLVSDLKGHVKGLKLELTLFRSISDKNYQVVEKRLNSHSDKVNKIDKEVAVLKSKINE